MLASDWLQYLHQACVLGRADKNISEVINEWGAYAGVLPQTTTTQFRAGINLTRI